MSQGRLGDILIDRGMLSPTNLDKALSEQKVSGKRLGDILTEQGFSKEEDIISILSEQMDLPYIDLFNYEVDVEIFNIVDETTIKKLKIIPLFKIEGSLTVAMADPLDIQVVDELTRVTDLEIQPVFATKSGIQHVIDNFFNVKSDLDEAIDSFRDPSEPHVDSNSKEQKSESIEEAPAIKLVNLIITQSVNERASDIHFQPTEKGLEVKQRIDGILHSMKTPPPFLTNAIISRLKILADLDIAEKRLPQDGRVRMDIEGKEIDLRISTFPTIHGENIVLRILDKSRGVISMEKIGLRQDDVDTLKELIKIPNGIILVAGPTGSGKTTSLYSFLNEIDSVDKNIITLEDPVEYRLKGIRQSNVDTKANLTFQVGLRAIMRQDPDIIMIGEIRDRETAEISIQAALTGHLVFSTIHTNNACATVARLCDMGIEPYLISTSLAGILSQRLIRVLCDSCKKPFTPPPALLETIDLSHHQNPSFYEEVGCHRCRQTGFRGRTGTYELLIPTEEIRTLINSKASGKEILKQALKQNFHPLRRHGIELAQSGITSLSEVLQNS